MGIKNQKGTVSIENYRERIRIRWRYQGIRYALNLLAYTKANLIHARKKASEIELDMALGCFDSSLAKYKGISSTVTPKMGFTEQYEAWVRDYMNMDCEVNTNYNAFRNMIRKWGEVNEQNVIVKFNSEQFCVGTYNRRLTMLKTYVKWLVKSGIWKNNPVEDVQPRRGKKLPKPKRKPFTEEEIKKILEAFKNDTYCPKSSRYKHSHYYPFIYFIFKTGVRNAEAIGLRVGKINLDKKIILINEVLARSLKGSSSNQRRRKETKNGKERTLPLTNDLLELLNPLIQGKNLDDLVFKSINGLPIDDNNLQKRVFKPILKELGIEERVLYACRHTFASRCIQSGISPVNTAFLMGNNPETTLRNYTHQIDTPNNLPII
ncbi:MAG: tyrosine-type recombinase/integrase [Sediminibacterium sp. Gen4]|jgi:integrase|uniref:site-specific integrase n=1 Tax=unclassified Sediminibacterium TaxID=2635961 RepID=UPI0015BDD0DA|nr:MULTISPECIES: site-specific integrase [unclassified Sediminibacterium]MBW0160197.1 site-specific integrase [Sediminibacterium sp.]MBW0163759.1 site-specific integrase [Sediminibacterium sp.]NWK67068.1 tyrosine-type recombinase/integrase [Sediminibacterium sp. Gen4]